MLESLAILIGIAAIAAKRLSRFPTITELAPPARFEENSRADNSERKKRSHSLSDAPLGLPSLHSGLAARLAHGLPAIVPAARSDLFSSSTLTLRNGRSHRRRPTSQR